ncbi:MAG: PQQ-binding-like beta-propeller repeat protein [Verrucomicrobiales bacterium]|nr:PQQ-binding-like beta-propeller repeat protein [Verrucomicrobiales bacterium]MCP5526563.1 PQQ-binding-like beta-propeller repeat protein [Verrucomicrobiales bacterium]
MIPFRYFGLCLLAVLGCAGERQWPQFRGPRGDGTSLAREVPVAWSEATNLAWKVALPGRGRSSPVTDGGRIWLTTALEEGVERTRIGPDDMQTAEHVRLHAVCLEAEDGGIVWNELLFDVPHPDPVHWLNSWATPTPVLEGDRLYCDFGTFGTACLVAATGARLWETRLPLDHQVGPGSSPVLFENLLILVRDGRDAQYVTALDKATGKAVWRTERPPIDVGSPNLKKSFSTPLLVRADGKTQLIAPGAHWVVAYDPRTGNEIWRVNHGRGFSIGTCPSFTRGLTVIGTGCMRADMLAIAVDGRGDVTEDHVRWRTPRQVPVMSSPVAVGAELYWVSDRGVASCVDAGTGENCWQERLGEDHLASPLFAEGRIYFFGQQGAATVVRAGRAFEPLATNRIEGTVIATPAVTDGRILLRTDTHLYAIGTPAGSAP